MSQQRNGRSLVFHDVVGLVGVALISGGAAMVYVPAGLIISGALLLVGAILMARHP